MAENSHHVCRTIWHMAFQTRPQNTLAPILSYGKIFSRDDWDDITKRVYAFYDSVPDDYVDIYNKMVDEQEIAIYESMLKCSRPKRKAKPGWVYVLRAGEYYKIGRSKRPKQRYQDLATLPPWPTEMVHIIKTKDMAQLESELHDKFATKHTNGEWFELDEEDVTWLKTL